jgi:hypothetical protein
MSKWKDLAQWIYGDVRSGRGFWYSHQVVEIDGLTDEQLFWVPNPKSLCILWHVGHIAHRERTHIGVFLQGLNPREIIPPQYEVFGTEWSSTKKLRRTVKSTKDVVTWVHDVREESLEYINSLNDDDFDKVTPTSESGLSVGHWLFITAAHTALHIGKIQLLRALVEDKHDRPC